MKSHQKEQIEVIPSHLTQSMQYKTHLRTQVDTH